MLRFNVALENSIVDKLIGNNLSELEYKILLSIKLLNIDSNIQNLDDNQEDD